jgi:CBS domain-containing protein
MASSPNKLTSVSEAVERGESPQETVRTILSWFNAQRRGVWVVSMIRAALEDAELTTEPDFESAYIDSIVSFRKRPIVGVGAALAAPATASGTGHVGMANEAAVGEAVDVVIGEHQPLASTDPSFRLSKLAAANRTPLSVGPDALLEEAVTKMLTYDYSQLPIMQNEREVRGVVSWRSIASRLATGKDGSCVREFADKVEVIEASSSLLEAVSLVVQHQYVLVRGSDRRIVGIVTSSDLSAQFQALTEPFLLLSEIENDLRRIIQAKYDQPELQAAKDPADTSRTIKSVFDMTFGEYVRLIDNPDRWKKLNVKLDRNSFVGNLNSVRRIRNDVMHFDPDGIPPEDLNELRNFAGFLARLRNIGVT